MTDQAAIDAALDNLNIQNDDITAGLGNEEPIIEPEIKNDEPIVDPEPIVEPKPPGFLTYEEWIEKGKDPAEFRGEKAYSAHYDSIQEVRELKGLVKTVQETTNDWKATQQAQMHDQYERDLASATAELNTAKEESDLDGALAAKDKISNLNKPAPAAQPVYEPAPEITKFRQDNPILDPNSPQYDRVFDATVIKAQSTALNRLTGGDQSIIVSSEELNGTLRQALAVAKDIYPDKFKSPRNQRRGQGQTPAKRTTPNTEDYGSRLKQLKSGSLNSRDTSPEFDTYEMIKAKDPKRAEKYAKTMLGE